MPNPNGDKKSVTDIKHSAAVVIPSLSQAGAAAIELSNMPIVRKASSVTLDFLSQDVTQYTMNFLPWRDLSVLARVCRQNSKTNSISSIAQEELKKSTEKPLLDALLTFAQHPNIIGTNIVYLETGFLWRTVRHESRFPDEKAITACLIPDTTPTAKKLDRLVELLKTPLEYYLRNILSLQMSSYRDNTRPHPYEVGFRNLPSPAINKILRTVLHIRFSAQIINLAECVRKKITLSGKALLGMNSNRFTEASLADGIKRLVECGADENVLLAYSFGYSEVTKVLLQMGANPNANCGTDKNPVFLAAPGSIFRIRPSAIILQILIKAGLDVNMRDHNGETLLMNMVDDFHSTQLLLDAKAEVNAVDNKGTTALMRAGEKKRGKDRRVGDMKVIDLLLAKHADVNKADKWGNTVLMSAVMDADVALVRRYIQSGADVHAKSEFGTVLFLAHVRFNNVKFNGGHTTANEEEIINLLKAAGAECANPPQIPSCRVM